MKEVDKRDATLAQEIIEAVQRHYPSGQMGTDSVVVVFGMTIVAAVSGQSFQTRKRVASILSNHIVHTPDALKAYRPGKPH
jgi:hypothetical protein